LISSRLLLNTPAARPAAAAAAERKGVTECIYKHFQ
jgi:hypothetical protein